MAFTAKDVQALRAKTGCGMMDCKKALTESEGDFDKAVDLLREKGLAAATKKAGRIAAEGIVMANYDEAKKVGAIIEVNSETDFVAKNEKFQDFVKVCLDTVIEQNPADVDALMKCKVAGTDETIEEVLHEKILVIGENLKVRRFAREEGVAAAYIHGGGRMGALVTFETSDEVASQDKFKELGKEVAMQVVAITPQYLNEESVPAEVVAHEKMILKEQVVNSGKPEAIAEKIVMGRMGKFYKENCLVDQDFIKDSDVSVSKHIANVAKELGGDIKVTGFIRFEKGEGLEKRKDDFAGEIAEILGK